MSGSNNLNNFLANNGAVNRFMNNTKLVTGPLQFGVYNAYVNVDAKNGAFKFDVVPVLFKKPHKRKTVNGLGIEVKEIKLLYGRMQVGAKHTARVTPSNENAKKHNYFAAQIDGYVFSGSEERKFLIKVYKNGKMQIASGFLNNDANQPEILRKYIVDTFLNKYKPLYNTMKYVNLVSTFKVNAIVNQVGIAKEFSRVVEYEPELSPQLIINWPPSQNASSRVRFIIHKTGKFQIVKPEPKKKGELTTITMNQVRQAYKTTAKDLVKRLDKSGFLKISNTRTPSPVVKKTRKQNNNETTNVNINKNITYYNNTVYKNGKNGIKIKDKKCASLPKPELKKIADKLGIVDATSKTTKDQLCSKIKSKVYGSFKIGSKPCLAHKKEELVQLAIARGIPVSETDTVKTICGKLNRPKPAPRAPSSIKREARQAVQNAKRNETLVKRRLTNNAIRENIKKLYGSRWTNQYQNVMPPLDSNLKLMRQKLNTASKNPDFTTKDGVLKKTQANVIKRDTVRMWKLERRAELNKKQNNFNRELENLMEKNSPSPIKRDMPAGTRIEQI
jgi:hypothetical protein